MTIATNLIDLPWVPVRRRDGTAANLGLRETFLDAHELLEITASSPLEHEAITRFLTTITALVVRAAGDDWDPNDAKFPAAAVEAALSQVSAHLDLASLTDPFMQDVVIAGIELTAAPVISLSLDRPNPSVQAWHFRNQLNERADGQVDWARLAVLLITFWYFSGENNLYTLGRKQAGSLCGKAGYGLHLFWQGPDLAQTLMANTPHSWTEEFDLPAWADRDGSISGATFEGGLTGLTRLWWGSYSPNTVMVWADEITGLPERCRTLGSRRQPKGMPAPATPAVKKAEAQVLFTQMYPNGVNSNGVTVDQKARCAEIATALGVMDEPNKAAITLLVGRLRINDPAGTMHAVEKVNVQFRKIKPGLAALRNLSAWYAAQADELLKERVVDVVLEPSLSGDGWALEFCHTEAKGTLTPVYTAAAWVGHTPKESAYFTLNPDEAKAVLSVAKEVEKIASTLRKQLLKYAILSDLSHAREELTDRFYVLADAACTKAIVNAVSGRTMTQDALKAISDTALKAFDEVITPFAGSTLGPSIIQARSNVQRDLAKTTKVAKVTKAVK